MIELGVNIDHVATLRQARRTWEPDPVWAAVEAHLGGADGITVHLREDRRHINDDDVRKLRELTQVKLNLEMAATPEMVDIAARLKPEMAMFVPEGRQEVTTEGGLDILADEAEWAMFLDEGDELAGLPGFLLSAMRGAAEERGQAGRYAVTLSRSIIEPFLTYSARRDLREKAFHAFTHRGENGGETDNRDNVARILSLRAEKARLLGYAHYAALKLDDTMAKDAGSVLGLLEPVWESAKRKAADDEAELGRIAAANGSNEPLAAWDWRYWQEKLRAEKYDFDEAQLKPYLQLERIADAQADIGRHVPAADQRHAKIAPDHVAEVGQVLVPNRFVQTHLRGDALDLILRRVISEDRHGRITRHEADQEEDHRGRDEDLQEHLQQTPRQKCSHSVSGPSTTCRARHHARSPESS